MITNDTNGTRLSVSGMRRYDVGPAVVAPIAHALVLNAHRRDAFRSEAVHVSAAARTGAAVREFTAMTHHQQGTFPPTLVFSSVDALVAAVQTRSITEIGCVTLQRSTPFEGGMLERRTSFALLTAHDTTRGEILSCSVFLKYGDFVGGDQLYMPAEEWRRQRARGEQVQHQLLRRLQALPNVRVLDAAYHVHPDVCMRFAGFTVDEPAGAEHA